MVTEVMWLPPLEAEKIPAVELEPRLTTVPLPLAFTGLP
jgi:hypothetical protein